MARFKGPGLAAPIDVLSADDGSAASDDASGAGALRDRSIGAILAELRGLTGAQIEQVLAYQRERRIRFGEAAVALGFVSADDVLQALSQQFHYPYAPKRTGSPELVTLTQPFSAQAARVGVRICP